MAVKETPDKTLIDLEDERYPIWDIVFFLHGNEVLRTKIIEDPQPHEIERTARINKLFRYNGYEIETAKGKIVGTETVLRGWTQHFVAEI